MTSGGLSQEELLKAFADIKQTELPTRSEIQEHGKEVKKRRRIAMIPKRRKPSQVRGHELTNVFWQRISCGRMHGHMREVLYFVMLVYITTRK